MNKLRELLKKEDVAEQTKKSIRWIMGRVEYLRSNQKIPGGLKNSSFSNPRLFKMGEMYLYHYDAKWKDKLPYWDAFPLTIPLQTYEDGWLGLNLHYLPPGIRIKFLNLLVDYAATPLGETRPRMMISYQLLKETERLSAYVPCVKRYLYNHVQGYLMRIYPQEWLFATYMPIAMWQKASASTVYRESRMKING